MKRGLIYNLFRLCAVVSFICLILGTFAHAEMPLPYAKPDAVGFSQDRLDRISALLREDTDSGKLIGAVALIARKGKIAYFETFGYQDKLAGKEMKKDTIFRLYSMSKPITSVALMMLFEEGRIDLFEPLDKYLPEFKDQKVGVFKKDEKTGKLVLVDTVPVNRKITVQDIFRHTAGLSYGFDWITKHPLDILYREKGAAAGGEDQTLAELVTKLGPLPLMYQPGTMWHYSYAHDVQARLVEVLSGMPFDKFLEERIFEPLGMKDTGFCVKEEDHDRLAKFAPVVDKKTGKKVASRSDAAFTKPLKMLSGGGGLVSTASDYLRFAQMLLNGGEFNGVRLLSPKTIAFMTSDHLGTIPQHDLYNSLGPGYGYGLGVGVRIAPGMSTWAGSDGDYYWGGAAGTVFWNDPKEDMVAMILFQDFAQREHYRRTFRNIVYQAVID